MTIIKAAAVAIVALSGIAATAPAQAGCLKGAIVGGLAGKMLGHGYAGAAAGCAYGVHKSHQDAARASDMQSGRSASPRTN